MVTPKTEKKSRFVDNGDGTVSDLANNIMWMKQDTWNELGRLINWHESQEYAREMNEKKFAGYGNWRIPTGSDARLLFDGGASNTDVEGGEIHLDPVFPSGCGFTTWTSETRGAKAAMGYDLRSAYEFWLAKENDGFPSAVRLVRQLKSEAAGEDGEPRFVNNGDGTVTDKENGLMWKADDSFLDLDKWVSWEEAKTFVQGLNRHQFANYTDWRMPTRKEVQTIFDPANPVTDKYGDTILLAPGFPPGAGQTCWTKTLHKTDRQLAIRFQFYNGDYKWHQMGLRSHGVRPVRSIKE
ncbi:hypothetical protein UR09_00630 [Candidatus Nitromaritima sp. SCGC AAA799-A02]|nr:hypothetical protein UR09_00630 [Candidatus Nitromaritima sp. SCGC AAA799-A02]